MDAGLIIALFVLFLMQALVYVTLPKREVFARRVPRLFGKKVSRWLVM